MRRLSISYVLAQTGGLPFLPRGKQDAAVTHSAHNRNSRRRAVPTDVFIARVERR